jgi:glyoxalase family protein
LTERGIPAQRLGPRFNESGLAFADPDGLHLEIVTHPTADAGRAWKNGSVALESALRGFHAVTIWAERLEPTARVLTDVLGFRSADQSDNRVRFATGTGGPGTFVDVRVAFDVARGSMGVGTVHHVAFRVADAAAQLAVRRDVEAAGLHPTPVVDRQYFQSVYFHEPGGVLFEIATDPPGFAIDEPVETLGQRLMLPPQYEPYRANLERTLPPIAVPGVHTPATP